MKWDWMESMGWDGLVAVGLDGLSGMASKQGILQKNSLLRESVASNVETPHLNLNPMFGPTQNGFRVLMN